MATPRGDEAAGSRLSVASPLPSPLSPTMPGVKVLYLRITLVFERVSAGRCAGAANTSCALFLDLQGLRHVLARKGSSVAYGYDLDFLP
eukprot:CAMPEP_0205958894 /NCGR_PEP_ID=MMETSP1459-20131121/52963_1 /ASSEMBLY_ACC=CAM_ASM_001120 /TAXON_ID=41880 /ORGANISM="Pycnococcus provasolii, Strain RCC931" /LENGTH=88 /DNA_ID=CAMNT_0053331447 /DNA_START=1 /DNA_END=264 /DNA_ORIENTATION=-